MMSAHAHIRVGISEDKNHKIAKCLVIFVPAGVAVVTPEAVIWFPYNTVFTPYVVKYLDKVRAYEP